MPGTLSPVRLSILDQSPITDHLGRSEALKESLRLAELADALGYHRIWFAEHHHSHSFASPAPEIMTALALERTERVRVGTGGILLPLYSPQKVAETMGLLQRVHGDRVDVGIGRASSLGEDFPQQLATLLRLLPDELPRAVAEPERRVWVLGTGGSSASLAAQLGTGYVHGHFLNPSSTRAGIQAYRNGIDGGPGFAMIAVRAVAAHSAERAAALAQAIALWRARKDLGIDATIPSIDRAGSAAEWSEQERVRAVARRAGIIHGTPREVRDQILVLADEHRVDEVMVNVLASGPADRDSSYRLLAEAFRSKRVVGSS